MPTSRRKAWRRASRCWTDRGPPEALAGRGGQAGVQWRSQGPEVVTPLTSVRDVALRVSQGALSRRSTLRGTSTTMHLSGWKRIGIVASVVWMLGGSIWFSEQTADRLAGWASSSVQTCENN